MAFSVNWGSSISGGGANAAAIAANAVAIQGTDADIAANVDAINERVKFVDSLTINVPADADTIQDALDLAAGFYSLQGKILILLADGVHEVSAELKNTHPNRIEIKSPALTNKLPASSYSGDEVADRAIVENHYPVHIVNTGDTNFLGNPGGRIAFQGVAILPRDTDNYVVRLNSSSYMEFWRCMFFGGKTAIQLFDGCYQRATDCTFLHMITPLNVYEWSHAQIINCDVINCNKLSRVRYHSYLRASGTNLINVSGVGLSVEAASDAYLLKSEWSCGARCFSASGGSAITIGISSSRPFVMSSSELGRVSKGSTLQLIGSSPVGVDLSGIAGSYLIRAFHGSHVSINSAFNNTTKICRLDYSSNGSLGGFTGSVSPAVGVVGNNNSLWSS